MGSPFRDSGRDSKCDAQMINEVQKTLFSACGAELSRFDENNIACLPVAKG